MTNSKKCQIVWLDLEMTGLDDTRDQIVEVAAAVSGWDFEPVAQFESGVHHDARQLTELFDACPFYAQYPQNKQKLLELSAVSPSLERVEQELCTFVVDHCNAKKPIYLAGNSIHMDRRFIRTYMPKFDAMLHYRMLDVSAWKLVMEGCYGKFYRKAKVHRAQNDIAESIGELRYYIEELKRLD